MSYSLIGIYAIYLIFVGIKGNSGKLKEYVSRDAKGFAPWIISILVLGALYESDTLRPAIKPFIGLALLTFTLKNYSVIVSQINDITGMNLPTGN